MVSNFRLSFLFFKVSISVFLRSGKSARTTRRRRAAELSRIVGQVASSIRPMNIAPCFNPATLCNEGQDSSSIDENTFAISPVCSWSLDTFPPVLCKGLSLSHKETSFEEDFIEVLVRRGVGRSVFNDCLNVFNKHNVGNFSNDARSCVRSLRRVDTIDMAPGRYFHFGLQDSINDALSYTTLNVDSSDLQIQINVDGLPISKSSTRSFWPILCRLVSPNLGDTFLVGLYCGLSKPTNVQDFLSHFLADLQNLSDQGIIIHGKKYNLSIHSIVCDAPARQYLKCIKSHTAYSACERCTVHGIHYHGTRYISTNCELRSDTSFRSLKHKSHHSFSETTKQPIVSPLCCTSIDMVNDFPLDYMHLVLLGVVRKFLKIWLGIDVGKSLIRKMHRTVIAEMNNRQALFSLSVPTEFQRRPRSFAFAAQFKASEFRTFLCYTSPYILQGILSNDGVIYNHFMCLVVAMRILLSPHQSPQCVNFARNCLKMFVEKAIDIYSISVLVYNVHSLLHIADDYVKFGSLDSVSCFPFENFMQKLKGYITRTGKELEQVVKRYHEKRNFGFVGATPGSSEFAQLNGQHFNGPTGPYSEDEVTQYSEVKYSQRTFRINSSNDVVCCGNLFLRIINILKIEDHVAFLAVQFEPIDEDVFSYPCKSSAVGIHYVGKIIPRHVIKLHVSEIRKCWFTPINEDKGYVVKLLHESY